MVRRKKKGQKGAKGFGKTGGSRRTAGRKEEAADAAARGVVVEQRNRALEGKKAAAKSVHAAHTNNAGTPGTSVNAGVRTARRALYPGAATGCMHALCVVACARVFG